MRPPAAFVLLLCFGWHLVAPCTVRGMPHELRQGDEVSRSRAAESSCWTPRTAEARDLVQAPVRQNTRLRLSHTLRVQRVTQQGLTGRLQSRHGMGHRPAYAARRRLRLLARARDHGPPA